MSAQAVRHVLVWRQPPRVQRWATRPGGSPRGFSLGLQGLAQARKGSVREPPARAPAASSVSPCSLPRVLVLALAPQRDCLGAWAGEERRGAARVSPARLRSGPEWFSMG